MRASILAASLLAAGLILACGPAASAADTQASNDYPTSARADYVLACMAANGNTHPALDHCSCSIDVIASILPFDKYEEADTIISMRQGVGAQAREFKAAKSLNDIVADLRRAQAEAEIRCFH